MTLRRGRARKLRTRFLAGGIAAAALLALGAQSASAESVAAWQRTLERVVRSVVVLRVSVPRSFDTQSAATTQATGFVVDAKRGLILTNRHVVNPGPVVAEAVFVNHEEVEVRAVYRDPVHDFGFYQYDPAEVEFIEPTEIQLVPEHARVGAEIRVVGNDAGEKLSILQGTLARLDRDAPNYGRNDYNDFNTFYFQAASATSGGSSGSPVVDVHGHAVAMNAGGSRLAASSFYLPLDRVVRALEYVREGKMVPRGTLETVFVQRPYDELRRLGLRPHIEAHMRDAFPEATGLLVVGEVVPGGPADGKLEVGDIVLRVGGVESAGFAPLEGVLDETVGEDALLLLERGGETATAQITVGDLHAITPDRYLETGGGIVHPLSYQQARNVGIPVRGLYVASPGYQLSGGGIQRGAVITEVEGEPVDSLADFEKKWSAFADGKQVSVRYFRLEQPRQSKLAVVTVDRLWFPMRLCHRDDAVGGWECRDSPAALPPETPEVASTTFDDDGERPVRDLAPSLVMVEFDIPFRIDGIHGERFKGTGLVVDAERGLVVVDRETVPVALGDASLIFAASVRVPGEVVYIHPEHGLAVVSYDPALLGDTPVRSATLRPAELAPNDDVWVVGLSNEHEIVAQETSISTVETPTLPLTAPPRFRETNLEVRLLTDAPSTVGAVLADHKGRVAALWAAFSAGGGVPPQSYFAAISTERIEEILGPIREGGSVAWRSLGAELRPLTLADGRSRGLSDEAARRLEEHGDHQRTVLSVVRLTAGTPSAELLEPGDLLLAVNGEPVTRFVEVERAAQASQVELTVLRDGEERQVEVPTNALDGRGTDRAVFWAGALLQHPHHAIAAQYGIPPEGVYVSWLWYGSPAHRYELSATRRIVAVDNVPVVDLDSFLEAVADRPDRSSVRLRTVGLEGRIGVITLKLDLQFWPTSELRRNGTEWEHLDHPRAATAAKP